MSGKQRVILFTVLYLVFYLKLSIQAHDFSNYPFSSTHNMTTFVYPTKLPLASHLKKWHFIFNDLDNNGLLTLLRGLCFTIGQIKIWHNKTEFLK